MKERDFLNKVAICTFVLFTQFAQAQLPADLPWAGASCANETIILQSGIAAVTCGVTTAVPTGQQWSFGLIDINGTIPGAGRDESTTAMYHHPSWTIEQIGNVYGIAINNTDGCIFLTASSNYGSGYLGNTGIINYGAIGGGVDDLGAAGTVYKIDGVTGQAAVFAQLPQQSASFTHDDCEGSDAVPRTSGVGLGNIAYDEVNDQYFVTNIEDGRIYRLDNNGNILDSYDPLIYDDGAAGITDLTDIAYGIAVEPGSNRVFFGTMVFPNGGNSPGTGDLPLYSIDLDASGGFVGTVDNTVLPAGVTNNYVGTETFHSNIPVGSASGCTYAANTNYALSDLSFAPNGELLAGIRVGCGNTFHTSYNHWGETSILTQSGGLYGSPTEIDVSATGQCGNDDGYGGVAYYELQDGTGDIQYVVSSSDILFEQGPHGIAVFDSGDATAGQISPLGAISYGVVDNGDPKGVGGDVEVFSAPNCCPIACEITGTTNETCDGGVDGTLSVGGLDSASGTYEYSIDNGTTWVSNAGAAAYTFNGLTRSTYTVLVRDLADPAACVSSCTAILDCEGMIETETDLVSGFANVNSTGGSDPANLPGALQPVGSTADNTNSASIGSVNRTIVLEFDDVLPAGTPVTISMGINFQLPLLGQLASATITDFTNSQVFSGGNTGEIQYVTFITGQATDKITIDSDNSTLNLTGSVWVDGASYTDVPIVTETFVCNECPPCPVTCTVTESQDATCIGGDDGSLTAIGTGSLSGNYEYSLDAFATAGQTSGIFANLTAGSYTVSVRDPNDITCQSTCILTLAELPVECPQCPPINCVNQFGEFTIIKNIP